MIFYRIAYWLLWFFFKIAFQFRIIDKKVLPEGPVIACANHRSVLDVIFFAFAIGTKRHPYFMAKEELFRNGFSKWLLISLGAIPVRRGKSDITSMKKCLKILGGGGLLVMFPEGTRTADGEAAKTGAAMLAIKTGAQFYPAYIGGRNMPFGKTRITVGTPYTPVKDDDKPTSENYRKIADELMENIWALKGRKDGGC